MIRKQVLQRRKFKYNFCDVFNYFFCCLSKASRDQLKKVETFRKHALFQKGKEKMVDELDAATLMKTVRNLKTMS